MKIKIPIIIGTYTLIIRAPVAVRRTSMLPNKITFGCVLELADAQEPEKHLLQHPFQYTNSPGNVTWALDRVAQKEIR